MKQLDEFEILYCNQHLAKFKVFDITSLEDSQININFAFKAIINKTNGNIVLNAFNNNIVVNVIIKTNDKDKLIDLKEIYKDIETTLNNYKGD